MNKTSKLKSILQQTLLAQLDLKITAAEQAILSAKESRDSNTKSSAGDKYETGRAMMQQELDKLEHQLDQTLLLKQELSQIALGKSYEQVEQGSLVFTNQGIYFIVFGYGKLKLGEEVYYVISMASPIGQVLRGKRSGEAVEFQGRRVVISRIY